MKLTIVRVFLSAVLMAAVSGSTAFAQTFQEQTFNDALALYENGQFEEAAAKFATVNNAKGDLFAGKSLFSAGNQKRAQMYLTNAAASTDTEIAAEATFTLALCEFRLKNFGKALALLYGEQNRVGIDSTLQAHSSELYAHIVEYLSPQQRIDVYRASSNPNIQRDVVTGAVGREDAITAGVMANAFRNGAAVRSDSVFNQFNRLLGDVAAFPADSIRYPRAPKGMAYNLGLVLPEFPVDDPDHSVSQGMYLGAMMAVENFNRDNADTKVFIKYRNTLAENAQPRHIMHDLVWNEQVDVVLGPLTSGSAAQMVPLAETYQVPLVAPLANFDTLNIDNPYFFQLNPTFEARGRQMARFAVNELEMDTIAVVAEMNTNGMIEAEAFKLEAEKLGARVPYFIVDDILSKGYEVSEFTKYFAFNEEHRDSLGYVHVDGMFAPISGEAASTVIDLILIDFEAFDREFTFLGSQEWGLYEYTEQRLEQFEIYFGDVFNADPESSRLKAFERDYLERNGVEANMFSYIGYDAANFILATLGTVQNPDFLKTGIRKQRWFRGLNNGIFFDGTHVNQSMRFYKMGPEGRELIYTK